MAVLDLDSAYQQITSYGEDATFDTASISKVNILAALLLQAQDEGRELTSPERLHAEEMIRSSDNEAANVLWQAIGRAEGLDAANERLGLSSTQGGISWGLTQTTARDQVKLLRAVFAEGRWAPPAPRGLTRASRASIGNLMDGITDDQDWGCPPPAPPAPDGPSRTAGYSGTRPTCGSSTASARSRSTGAGISSRSSATATRRWKAGSHSSNGRRERRSARPAHTPGLGRSET
ncbi:serine hydrolase [Streptomyces sp. MS1.AVA.1]|uniref:Serine hydrolase n=1 Tax=Streptomyces machairae TaxID=3134109 RepID=A0ABU8UVM6_9ACTN